MVGFDFPRTIRSAQPRQLARTSDGDTPVIDQPIRMVSIDTPEKQHYAGLPPTAQAKLNRCRDRLQRLTRPDGGRRRVAVIPTGELIDRYGRLLA